jgi:PAS domain S-box-containing protein
VLIGASAAMAAFRIASEAEHARIRGVIELRAEWRARDVERKLGIFANPVEAMAVLFASEETMNGDLFNRFAATSHTAGDPLRRLAWAPRMAGLANDDSEHFPVELEHTFVETQQLLGVDLTAEPERRAVIARARDEARSVSTSPLALLNSPVTGYVVFRPVYRTGTAPDTVEQRRAALRGMLEGTFGVEDALNAALRGTPPLIEDIYFFAGRPTLPAAPVATYAAAANTVTQGGAIVSASIAAGGLRLTRSIDVFGQEWTLIFAFNRAALAPLGSPWTWASPTGVLLLTALLATYVARERGYRRQVESAVAARTTELSRANLELNAIIRTSPVGIFMVDRDGIVTLWSASAERIFGYAEEEALRHLPPYLTDEHMTDFRANVARALNETSPGGSLDARRRRKDGAIIEVTASWARVTDDAGQLVGIMYAVTDVTDRKKLEGQLQQAQKMEAIGNLTGGMAHDFNNLLGIIIGNLDLLKDQKSGDPDSNELVGEALDAGLRGADLTRRLLAFARRQPLQPTRIAVNELIATIIKLLGRTLGEQIQISLDLDPDTWPIVADPAQLESTLTNLATNARDAMPRGGQLTIVTGNRYLDEDYAALHAEVQPGEYAVIEISDTGTGMPPDIVTRIFEPFYTTKEQGKGTGLGLSMVFGFMKQSGGHINVYSEVGIGTTFRLYLPRAKGVDPDGGVAVSAATLRGSGETVLAVEDNASLRRVVVRQLTELGYRVLEAEDAATAFRVLEGEQVDLLFTDVVMPGGTNGYEIAFAVQARWPAIKVVLTSGFPEHKINGTLGAPNLRLLSKPYRRDDLARLIREVFDS